MRKKIRIHERFSSFFPQYLFRCVSVFIFMCVCVSMCVWACVCDLWIAYLFHTIDAYNNGRIYFFISHFHFSYFLLSFLLTSSSFQSIPPTRLKRQVPQLKTLDWRPQIPCKLPSSRFHYIPAVIFIVAVLIGFAGSWMGFEPDNASSTLHPATHRRTISSPSTLQNNLKHDKVSLVL